MSVVTSRQRYVSPLMDHDEVRLANPRKTKVLSVRPDKSSTTTTAPPGRALGVHVEVHLWDIDDGETPGFYTTATNGL